jgi:FkbM family methyltransferase
MLIESQKIKHILDHYNIKIKGALHIGAHKCEERSVYHSWGISDNDVIWVDANEELIKENIALGIPNCYYAILDETERETKFKITNNGQSSSLLDFGTHKVSYPDIYFTREIDVKTQTLGQFVKRNGINISNFNFWNFDIQGSEFAVFNGSKEFLKYADCIYTEVNTADVYKGCGKLDQIDTLLEEYGLKRVVTEMTGANWGDAMYVRVSPYVTNSISIAIPTYKRFSPFLENYIPKYLEFEGIEEIIIGDETGEDIEMIKKQPWGNNPKLRFIKNHERLGAYHNKLNLLKQAMTDWIILIDSDNELLPEYIIELRKYWMKYGADDTCVYIPADMESRNINETQTKKQISHLGGICVFKDNWNWFLGVPMAGYALNLGNCVFHKSQVSHIPDNIPKDVMVDCQVVNKTLVEKGFKLIFVPEMKYYHIVHSGSLYLNNIHQMQKFERETRWEL